MTRLSLPLLLLLSLLSSAACEAEDASSLGSAQAPIVNGELEDGWESVGAMTAVYPGRGYLGSFCTGSLVAPQWVLTAAHCVVPSEEMPLEADMMAFYIGADARPVAGERPTEGRFVPIDVIRAHPEYVALLAINDIALVHLAEPVEDVPLLAYRQELLQPDDIIDRRATYVGFGVTDGIEQEGGGIKRSTTLLIDALLDWYYRSVFEGTGVCFGDSGGPGLLEFEGTWNIVGVNSLVVGGNPDPCGHKSTHARVDVFADWLAENIEGEQPDCRSDADMCLCPEACNEDGGCDNTGCAILSCRAVLACENACAWDDDLCPARCKRQAAPSAETTYGELNACRIRECDYQEERDPETCLADFCPDELAACNQLGEGIADCPTVTDCAWACPLEDAECVLRCEEKGTREAQVGFERVQGCLESDCAAVAEDERLDCLTAACAGFVGACGLLDDSGDGADVVAGDGVGSADVAGTADVTDGETPSDGGGGGDCTAGAHGSAPLALLLLGLALVARRWTGRARPVAQ